MADEPSTHPDPEDLGEGAGEPEPPVTLPEALARIPGARIPGRARSGQWKPKPAGPPGAGASSKRVAAYLEAAVTVCTDQVAAAPEGTRNHTVYANSAALGRLAHLGLTEAAAAHAMATACQRNGLGGQEARKAFRSGWTRGVADPKDLGDGAWYDEAGEPLFVLDPGEFAPPAGEHAPPSTSTLTLVGAGAPETFTDAWWAHAYAARHRGRLAWVVAHRQWYAFDGVTWSGDDGAALLAAGELTQAVLDSATGGPDATQVRKAVRAEQAAGRLAATVRLAAPLLARGAAGFDPDPWVLNTPGGIVDLRTGRLREARPGDWCTRVTAAAPVLAEAQYAPAPAWVEHSRPTDEGGGAGQGHRESSGAALAVGDSVGLWGTFLRKVQPDPDARAYLARVAGMALVGEVREHALVVLVGSGRNGKSVFLGALAGALGTYALTVGPEVLLTERSAAADYTIAQMSGRRLVVASELNETRTFDSTRIKHLTGGDEMTGRHPYGRPFTFTPSHTLLLATNHRPRVTDTGAALWSRMHLVPWPVTIKAAEMRTDLPMALRGCYPDILTWALAGLADYRNTRALSPTAAMTDAVNEYRIDEDPLGRFITDRCHVGENLSIPASVLWREYLAWCADEGETPTRNQNSFGRALSDRGYASSRTDATRLRLGITVTTAGDPWGQGHLRRGMHVNPGQYGVG